MKVQFQHLTKIYPSRVKKGPDVFTVNDVSFTMPDGQLVALLGPSGCGKSTLLDMTCGLTPPSGGRIFFGEEDVTELPPEKRGVGIVFQNYSLYPHMTAAQNIAFPLGNLRGKERLSREEIRRRVTEAAKLVQIETLLDRKPGELSGGQQQRVAIARTLVKMPRILLLDEPLSNLDARLRLQMREEIRRIQKQTGITTAFVTHDQEEAMSIADLIVVMKKGQLQQVGRPQEVYDDPTNLFVATFMGTPPINIFDGEVREGSLVIGGETVMAAHGVAEGPLLVGIRPEGLDPDPEGTFHCETERVEIMGRDAIVLSRHPGSQDAHVRSVIEWDPGAVEEGKPVTYRIKPRKLFLFSGETGQRIPFAAE